MKPIDTRCEMTWIVMPSQANALGTAFGGQVLSWMDICAAVSAKRFCRRSVVTAGIDSVAFKAPARQGDVVVIEAMVNWAGRTSMEVGCRVLSEDLRTGQRRRVATAYLTFVALDDSGSPVTVPTLEPESDAERRRSREAAKRRAARLRLREELER